MSMYRKKERKLTLTNKRNLIGYVFIFPFIIGFVLFVLSPIITSIIFSLSKIMYANESFSMEYIGFANYYELFRVDPLFNGKLLKGISKVFLDTPLIIIFSFMMANILNQQFKGRTLSRVIFFLPVVVTSGVMATMSNDALNKLMTGTMQETGNVEMLNSIKQVVGQMNLGDLSSYVTSAAERIYDIVNASGVQILVFLAGLQTVTPSLFEASDIEGATAWENFWKITFPMVSPMILVNLVYTIVDAMQTEAAEKVTGGVDSNSNFAMGSAKGWVFFVCVIIFLMVLTSIISKMVYYENE